MDNIHARRGGRKKVMGGEKVMDSTKLWWTYWTEWKGKKKDEQSERAGLLHFSMDSAWPTFFIRLKRGNNRIYIFFIIIDLFVVEDVIFDSSVTSMAPF